MKGAAMSSTAWAIRSRNTRSPSGGLHMYVQGSYAEMRKT